MPNSLNLLPQGLFTTSCFLVAWLLNPKFWSTGASVSVIPSIFKKICFQQSTSWKVYLLCVWCFSPLDRSFLSCSWVKYHQGLDLYSCHETIGFPLLNQDPCARGLPFDRISPNNMGFGFCLGVSEVPIWTYQPHSSLLWLARWFSCGYHFDYTGVRTGSLILCRVKVVFEAYTFPRWSLHFFE